MGIVRGHHQRHDANNRVPHHSKLHGDSSQQYGSQVDRNLGIRSFFLLMKTSNALSSAAAVGGRLTSPVSPFTRFMRAATNFSAPPCSKGFQAFWASSACAASATSYPSCSAAPLSWPSGFAWAAHVFKAGRSLLAFGSNSAVKRTASPPLTLVR